MKRKKYIVLIIIIGLLITPVFSKDLPIITVLNFESESISESEMKSVISLLSSALFKTGNYTVIDTAERDTIMKEMEFSLSGCSDESCQIELGKLLSAEMIVVGSIGNIGSNYIFTAKILETSTSRTLSTADGIYDSLDSLVADLFRFAEELAGADGDPEKKTAELSQESAAESEEIISEPGVTISSTPEEKAPVGILPIITLAGGVGAAGVGGYLLYSAVQYYSDEVDPAWNAYDTAPPGSDFDTLNAAYQSAQDSFKSKFVIGAAVAGTGIILSVVSIVLFTLPDKTEPPDISFLPVIDRDKVVSLSFNIRI